ncbi:hypothetical protein EJ04DRAFT_539632 [Polyplosphaeria fusca]|uniref:CENP-T/Histone H4 histone fold domain-containing protein n=1 Tax=Polyplosphaeria fusca TaxID=682080 RepID=A0A9P4RDJ6_9PLEO|nr:hypothetical protein EJ04DRAFT_539632 [Polyplosphaeria fusca]
MSESARKRQRTTPRTSEAGDLADRATPHSDLRQLASIAPRNITPFRRASSAGPTPGSRRTPNILIRTPGTAARTPRGLATRPIQARRAAPTTPHAIRALRERANAARTPGHHRRRSGRIQRETPRDTLRDLSRVLARTSRPPQPATLDQGTPRNPALDLPDVEDGPDPVAPRLSMPLDDMYDDDSFHEAPPRQSLLPDLPDDADTGTIQSLEFGRRAFSEDRRYGRISDRFAELNDLDAVAEEFEIDGAFINRRTPNHLLQRALEEDEIDDTTTEIRALTGRRDGRRSDVDLGVFGEDDEPGEPTFQFVIPQRMRSPIQPELPIEEEEEEVEGDENISQVGSDVPVGEEEVDQTDGPLEQIGWESDHGEEDDIDLQAYREEVSAVDRSIQTEVSERSAAARPRPPRQRREVKISRFGHEYPSFPAATVKKLASSFAKSQGSNGKIGKETLETLVQTSDWFFEQIGEDLAAYAQHAGRKMIEEDDVVALMKRQRQITGASTVFSLAQKLLPRELLQQLRMPPPKKLKGQKRKRMEPIREEEDNAE